MSYKNIIFDLGGVILDLSVERTIQAFAELSGKTREQVLEIYSSTHELILYETGKISDDEFREAVQRQFGLPVSNDSIDKAWNAMLVHLPKAKLDLLLRLKNKFTVCLLSNTNNIHLNYVNSVMLPLRSEFPTLGHYFHRPYYSHLLRMRKPDAEIFNYVLSENNFSPTETVFLDDNTDNIRTASKLGMQTVLVKHPNQVMDFFDTI